MIFTKNCIDVINIVLIMLNFIDFICVIVKIFVKFEDLTNQNCK
jgi:hypothetical protein